jgi:DnaJ-class molecular chaperone
MERNYRDIETILETRVDDRQDCDFDEYEPKAECHLCNGRGHNIEGRTCPYCEGSGYSDF